MTPYNAEFSRLESVVNQFLWDQWSVLGIRSNTRGEEIPFIIDLEALLLATSRFCSDNRLLVEVANWSKSHSDIINAQRVKNIINECSFGDEAALGKIFSKLPQRSKARFSKVCPISEDKFEDRPFTRKPDFTTAATAQIRMRLLYGNNARADIISWFLCETPWESGHANLIAKQTHWFPKSVHVILSDLERGGFLKIVSRKNSKPLQYSRETIHPFPIHPMSEKFGWFEQTRLYEILYLLSECKEKLEASSSPAYQALTSKEVTERIHEITPHDLSYLFHPSRRLDEDGAVFRTNVDRLTHAIEERIMGVDFRIPSLEQVANA